MMSTNIDFYYDFISPASYFAWMRLREILTNAGFDPEQVADAMAQPQIKTALIEATDAAAKRGVFGAPTFFVNDEMFFGQDRMDWVKRALG